MNEAVEWEIAKGWHDRAMDLALASDQDRVFGLRRSCTRRLERAVHLEGRALARWPQADPWRRELAKSYQALKLNVKWAKRGVGPYAWGPP